jgi:hypothetical protein
MQAKAEILHDTVLKLEVSDLMMRYDSHITADNITITAGKIHMEGEAKINTTGRSVVWDAPGDGMVDGNGYGVGGSHGGYGGGNVQSNFTNGWCLPY